MPAGAWLAIVGGAIVGIGTFLPWMSFTGVFSLNRNAFQLGNNLSTTADGPVLLVLAIVTVLIGITRLARSSMPRFFQRSTLVTGLVMLIWVILEYSSVHSFVTQHSTNAILGSVGYGYWLCIVGSATTLVSGLVLRQKRQTGKEPDHPLVEGRGSYFGARADGTESVIHGALVMTETGIYVRDSGRGGGTPRQAVLPWTRVASLSMDRYDPSTSKFESAGTKEGTALTVRLREGGTVYYLADAPLSTFRTNVTPILERLGVRLTDDAEAPLSVPPTPGIEQPD